MNHDRYDDAYIADILAATRTIALVGASPKPSRASHDVMAFLQAHGYRVLPVNPQAAGTMILGERCVAMLADIATPIDMVDVFRASDAVPAIVEQAILAGAKTIWLQLRVTHPMAAERAESAGLRVVMDRCPKIEISRLKVKKISNGE